MATYTELVDMVRTWANRDAEVLPSATIKTFINFAADNIYRDLRIAPLEYVYAYDTDTIEAGQNTLPIPSDAIEFIQLRKQDDNSLTGYSVYAAKSDIRSFYQEEVGKNDYFYYTRERGNLILHPDFTAGEQFELFYYRRLPEMDARFTLAQAGTDTEFVSAAQAAADPDLTQGEKVGREIPNWLRDENVKLVLFGALVEAFQYLDEPAQAQAYAQRFDQEMRNLNDEENKRKYMGGNVQLHYKSYLI